MPRQLQVVPRLRNAPVFKGGVALARYGSPKPPWGQGKYSPKVEYLPEMTLCSTLCSPPLKKSGTELATSGLLTSFKRFVTFSVFTAIFIIVESKTSWAAGPTCRVIVSIPNRSLPLTQETTHQQLVWEASSSNHEELGRERMKYHLAKPNEIPWRTIR